MVEIWTDWPFGLGTLTGSSNWKCFDARVQSWQEKKPQEFKPLLHPIQYLAFTYLSTELHCTNTCLDRHRNHGTNNRNHGINNRNYAINNSYVDIHYTRRSLMGAKPGGKTSCKIVSDITNPTQCVHEGNPQGKKSEAGLFSMSLEANWADHLHRSSGPR